MGEALTERDLQFQKERQRRNKVLALVGLFLLILGLGGWVISMAFSSPSTTPITRTIPSSILHQSASGEGCYEGICVDPSQIYFIIPQGQSNQHAQTVFLEVFSQTVGSWSAMTVTSQGSNWLGISPTQGDLSRVENQQISILVSANTLAVGVYRGAIKFSAQGGLMAVVDVYVKVIPASQKDLVEYTPLSDLTIIANWPHLIKDHAVNVTISLLSQNLSRDLPRAPTLAKLERIPLPGIAAPFYGDAEHQPLEFALQPLFPELMFVSANLDGTSFDIAQSDPPPQTPYQRIVSFHWNILPKEAGLQGFAVDFAGQWTNKEHPSGLETFYFLGGQFAVNVDDDGPLPFITFGQVTLGSLLLGLLGSALNIPWLLDYIQKRKKKRHTSHVSSSNTSPGQGKQRRRKSHRATHRD